MTEPEQYIARVVCLTVIALALITFGGCYVVQWHAISQGFCQDPRMASVVYRPCLPLEK